MFGKHNYSNHIALSMEARKCLDKKLLKENELGVFLMFGKHDYSNHICPKYGG
jgi:hypothetical protein